MFKRIFLVVLFLLLASNAFALRRYYISPVIEGTDPDGFPSYKAKIADYPVNYVAVISPNKNWALVIVNSTDQSAIIADTDVNALPDITLDSPISLLSSTVRNTIKNYLQTKGLDISDLKLTDAYRTLIRRVGQFIDNNFDENKFDVSE